MQSQAKCIFFKWKKYQSSRKQWGRREWKVVWFIVFSPLPVLHKLGVFFVLAVLGLCCCARAFSSCGERGLLFIAVRGLLICGGFPCCGARGLGAWASVIVARGLRSCGSRALEHRLSSCGAQASLLRGMWDLPGPRIKPVSPALAGGFLTTAPPGKSKLGVF